MRAYNHRVSESANRRPHRLDVAGQFPRLVTGDPAGEGSESAEGQITWNAQTDLILNAAGEGIYGIDLDGRCTFVNPAAARMTGHSVGELVGESMHDVVHHSHGDGRCYEREECPIYAAFADGMIRNVCDEVFWRKDGSSFPVEYTSTPIYAAGRLIGAVVVFRDISLRRQTEDRLKGALREVQRLKERLQRENTSLRQAIEVARGQQDIIGNSAALREMMRLICRVAATDASVLVQGETGTGKELVARAIHRMSQRRGGPLVKVNCAAITPQLADSELFGHERGAFTGAVARRPGRFEQASGGTLFLDEIGELPLETQSKLLRVLQEREFERVGGNETLNADVRLVTATNRDLCADVKAGKFRADLYFRLNVMPVSVPRLRDRTSDIPALTDHFLEQLEKRLGRELGRVSEAGLRRLAQYHWPGNVRELNNVIERAAILSDGSEVEVPEELFSFVDDLPTEAAPPTEPSPQPPANPAPSTDGSLNLDDVERRHILQVLERTKWRLSGAAGASTVLGLHPNTLRHRMKKLGISR